jgi:biotin transport system substrate-specific component
MTGLRSDARISGGYRPTSLTWRWPLVMALGAAAVALAAQLAVPLPFSPVPMSLQGFAVLVVGGTLGGTAGAGALALYLIVGAFGAPVFAMGTGGVYKLLGPTGGYLLAFPFAAALVGRVAVRGHFVRCLVACLLGTLVIHTGGLLQLLILHASLDRAIQLGTAPFLTADILKAGVAAVLITWSHQSLRPRT